MVTGRNSTRATLKDVARESGVSPTTVSFVLNETPGQVIPTTTRDRVHAAAARLGYTPHRIARALREGTSRVVLLNTAGLPTGHSLDSFIAGLDDELRKLDHTLLVTHRHRASPLPHEVVESFAPRAVLDLGALYSDQEDADWEGGWVDGMAAHGLAQLRHLAQQGHRHLAVTHPRAGADARFGALRLEHARQAALTLGLPEPVRVPIGETRDEAALALTALRRDHPTVTAIAAFDDDTALLTLSALASLGIAVPTEIAVIGFDEGPHGAIWHPSLTTLRIDAEAYGRRAARQALGREPEGAEPITPGSIIVRRESA